MNRRKDASIEAGGNTAQRSCPHILNNFDIPKGAVRDDHKDAHGNLLADHTLWTSATDLKARRFYFRTYENSQIRSLDLMTMPLDAKSITRFSMKGAEAVKSLNP